MQRKKPVSLVLLMLVSGGAFAAIGDGKAVVLEKPSQVHQTVAKQTEPVQSPPEAKSDDAASTREASTKACEQAISAAASMSEKVAQLSNEILPKVMQTGEEFARQVEPTVRQFEPVMREFADRLRDLALQMERSLREPPSQGQKP